jgi:hypothetical protein
MTNKIISVDERLPRWIKAVHTEGPFVDDAGTPYFRVTTELKWWFVPLAWWFRWRSKPVGGFEGATGE